MIAVLVSGGKGSTATLLLALEIFPKHKVVPVFTDTGWESERTYTYLAYLEKVLGIEIVRLKSREHKDLLHLIEKKHMFPHGNQRFCTYHLKIVPVAEYIAERGDIEEIWLGMRAEESHRRAKKYGHLSPEDTYPYVETATGLPAELRRKLRNLEARLPLVNWTEREVFDYLKKKGIEPNPLYSLGHSRVGCYPCILGGTSGVESVLEDRGRQKEHTPLDRAGGKAQESRLHGGEDQGRIRWRKTLEDTQKRRRSA